jgi:hypothetical protein
MEIFMVDIDPTDVGNRSTIASTALAMSNCKAKRTN